MNDLQTKEQAAVWVKGAKPDTHITAPGGNGYREGATRPI